MAEKNLNYTYCNHNTNLFIIIPSIGWMRFGNNPAIRTSLYINTIVIEDKCKGHGSRQLKMLKMFSDDTETPLSLICFPLQGSDPVRLNNFYKNNGFISEGGFYVYNKMEAGKEIDSNKVYSRCSAKR